jgi:hypothetical protein
VHLKGIFNTDGNKAYMLRKIASRFFTTATLRYVRLVSVEHGEKVLRKLDVALRARARRGDAAASDGSVDLEDLFSRFTLDTFAQV